MLANLNFNHIQAMVTDLDGVLLQGVSPLPGMMRLVSFLHQRGFPFIIATNNSTKTPDQYCQIFAQLGALEIQPQHILTSALVTTNYLQRHVPSGSAVYVIGQPSLSAAIQTAGFRLVEDVGQPATAVVVGGDPDLTYHKLKIASLHVQRGARFIGTNPDVVYPTAEGLVPEAGTILAALAAATGVAPLIVGKPERFLFEAALKRLGSQAKQTVMLGDRLDTDILGAQRVGLKTVLVTTGVDRIESIQVKKIQPDLVVAGLDELLEHWQKR